MLMNFASPKLRLGLAVCATLTLCGCPTVRMPQLASPGSAGYQRANALQFDPYPLDDVAPPVTSTRPREYDRPIPEVKRGQIFTPKRLRAPTPVAVPAFATTPIPAAPPSAITAPPALPATSSPFAPPATVPYQTMPSTAAPLTASPVQTMPVQTMPMQTMPPTLAPPPVAPYYPPPTTTPRSPAASGMIRAPY